MQKKYHISLNVKKRKHCDLERDIRFRVTSASADYKRQRRRRLTDDYCLHIIDAKAWGELTSKNPAKLRFNLIYRVHIILLFIYNDITPGRPLGTL